jgi:phosphoglycolate phosphatase-like HAD superfamily hydrolase
MSKPSGPHICILDIDGTMIPSSELDNRCYWQAMSDVFGRSEKPADLSDFMHVTDTGILREWHTRTFGSELRPESIAAVKERFLHIMQQAATDEPDCFRPLPGIEEWIGIQRDKGWILGIATGGWRNTADFKLRVSGLERFGMPLASSDDANSRTGIMQIALQRVLFTVKGQRGNARVRYVGDGLWDLAASRELGWNFIGIGSGAGRAQLLAGGASLVVRDFRQLLPDSG